MKSTDKLMDMLCHELDEIAEKGQLSAGDLDAVHKLIVSKEKLLRCEELEENLGYSQGAYPMSYSRSYNNMGYSQRGGDWEARGSYGRGGNYDDGNSYRGGRYSRDDGIGMMGGRIQEMLNDPNLSPQERNALKRAMEGMR